MNPLTCDELLRLDGPSALIVTARLEPVGGVDRFQPAGFPEIGHVLYDAPRGEAGSEKVCIVDSAASMANHLETVCLAGSGELALDPDLAGLPHVLCVTDRNAGPDGSADPQDPHDRAVFGSLTEGHRLASDYFLDGLVDPKWGAEAKAKGKGKKNGAGWSGTSLRERLREDFGIREVQKDKKYFIFPDSWWTIYRTIFRYDPNSLVHGVLFAKEQIKVARLLTAHLEAFGAARVGRSGVKFDRLGLTTSGQPIFSVDEETAREIRGTFILDLALLRSYGRGENGLTENDKRLLLELALWKIRRLLCSSFRYRTGCHLRCAGLETFADETPRGGLPEMDIRKAIEACGFGNPVTRVYYPATELFKAGEGDGDSEAETQD